MNTSFRNKINDMFWADLCMFYYQIEDFDHAVQTAKNALDEQPGNCTAYLVMGLVHEKKGDFEMAIQRYNEILRLHRNDPVALKRKAGAEVKLEKYREALNDINESLEFDKTDPEAYVIRGLIYFQYYHDKIEAILNYNEALRIDPHNLSALYHRGYSFLSYGNYNYARDDFAKASFLGSEKASEMLSKYFASQEFIATP